MMHYRTSFQLAGDYLARVNVKKAEEFCDLLYRNNGSLYFTREESEEMIFTLINIKRIELVYRNNERYVRLVR